MFILSIIFCYPRDNCGNVIELIHVKGFAWDSSCLDKISIVFSIESSLVIHKNTKRLVFLMVKWLFSLNHLAPY